MKAVHKFFGKVMLATGALFLGFILTDLVGLPFPLWLTDFTFAIFGVALATYAFTFKRWREDEPE